MSRWPRALLGLAILGVLALAAVKCVGALGPSQGEADASAERLADYRLVDKLTESVDRRTPGQSRVQAADAFLGGSFADKELILADRATWAVISRHGSSFRVVVYARRGEGTYADDYLVGRACRDYDVKETVAVRRVDCPASLPPPVW